ncbi:MAG: MarR family transcriptional regulator [Alphaproteobacteria bacterium]|nr:MarR family transcriptional regulator [Alphaproteobacteria bacterium]
MTKAREQATANELANRIFFRLYQCANMLHKTGTRALDDYGITTQQWAVLGALSRDDAENSPNDGGPNDGGLSVGDLARVLMVSRQNLTGVLARLEKRGLVEKSVDPGDARSRRVQLSHEGRNLWHEALLPKIFGYYEEALEGFSINERVSTLNDFNRLLENFKVLDLDGSGDATETEGN